MALIMVFPALAFAGADPCMPASDWDQYLARGWVWMYLGAFGFGFLTSLTPCVYPMIPIVVGVFGARDESVTRIKAFALATAYVLGMGVMYSILGMVFALLGKQFGTILGNPWVVIPLVGFYVVLAVSMFGAFDLNLPASWQARLNQVGGRGYGGAFGMGLVGGLTAAPCTGPFLAGILGFVAQTRNMVAGPTLLFTYALGMGILFWLIGVFAVSLPKSGRWMEWIKSAGGVALLSAAVYFLRPILPVIEKLGSPSKVFLFGAIAVALLGVLIGALHLSFHDAWLVRIRKALGVLLMVLGITGVVNWVLVPDRHLPWLASEDAAFAQARAQGKGVMLDFAADWCTPCKELELTFASSEVYDAIVANFVPLKLDVTQGTAADEALQARWKADTLPAVIFVDAQGNEVGRVSMYQPPQKFLETLGPAIARVHGRDSAPCAGGDRGARGDSTATSGASGTSGAVPAPVMISPVPAAAGAASTQVPAAESAGAGAAPVASTVPAASVAAAAAATTTETGRAPDSDGPSPAPAQASSSGGIAWVHDDVEAFLNAELSGKGVFIDFYADWCAPCIEMKKTFADHRVVEAISASYVPVHLDVSKMTEQDQAKLAAYGVTKLPAMVLLDASGEERTRITDYMGPPALLATMSRTAGATQAP